jgi:hypothetical protein
VGVEEGRVLLLPARPREAAEVLERGVGNARSQALAALAWLRAGDEAAATRLLGRAPGHGVPHQDEGDTAQEKMGERDLVARLLDLGRDERFDLLRLPLLGGAGATTTFEDVDGDGKLDARVGNQVALLDGWSLRGERTLEASLPVPSPWIGAAYDFEAAARFALAPPARVDADPPGTTARLEADLDGDGRLDRVVACGGDDPSAPLPWWWLRAVEGGYAPVRGSLPEAGWRVSALAAADLDGDGRAELLLSGGGRLPGDTGSVWLARWRGEP